MRTAALAAAAIAAVWAASAASDGAWPFTAHMARHLGIVAIAAPLLAWSVAGRRYDPAQLAPSVVSPVPASLIEFGVVWAWHVPAWHHAARTGTAAFAAEQASFLGAAVLLWASIFGGEPRQRTSRAAAGILALTLTLAHMTLLGALLALSPRPLYGHGGVTLADQQHGGSLMVLATLAMCVAGGAVAVRRLLGAAAARPADAA
jgi:putative membrane protein